MKTFQGLFFKNALVFKATMVLNFLPPFKSIAPTRITVVATNIENIREGNLDTNLRLINNNVEPNCNFLHDVGALTLACLQIKH